MATNPWTAEIARINRLISLTQANIARDKALLAANPNSPDAPRWRTQIESGENYLIDLRSQLDIFVTEYNNYGKDPVTSSGQIVASEQQARSQDAVTQNPPPPPGSVAVTGITDEELAARGVETGTNGRIRPLSETQATPQPVAEPFAFKDDDGNPLPLTPTQNAGVGARSDDSPAPTPNSTAQIINASFNQKITPQPNILDQYASYTYAISWYLLTPAQYNEMITSQKRNCASWQLLIQSAGAPVSPSAGTVGIRNQFFNQDYYLDDLEIDSVIPLKGTGAANTATDIKFKVTEPNGISLIQNLYKAVSTLYKQQNVSKTPNYPMAQYCLVIRFYGYNESGDLIQVGNTTNPGGNNAGPVISTDNRAVVEKFYPFVISNITFKVANKIIEYNVHAKPIPHFYNKSQDRGTIPFAFELVGETINELLVGKPVGTQYPGEDGRTTNPTPPATGPAGENPVSTNVPTISGSANEDVGGGTTFSLGVGA